MTDHATAPTIDDDPTHAVWQEYPVSLFGDAMRAITVLLGAVAAGCALGILLALAVQLGFRGVLSTWIPTEDVDAWGIATFLVAMLTTGLAASAPAIPGLLAGRSLDRTLLAAIDERAPRTHVPHPIQQRGIGDWGAISIGVSAIVVVVAGIYLLVRILIDPGYAEYWYYGAVVLGYALLLVALTALLRVEERRAVARFPRLSGKKKKKKRKRATPFHVFRAYWSKAYRGAVWTRAARAAGFDSIGEARRAVKKAEATEDAKRSSRLRPPQVGGGGPPLPTSADAKGPEWVYRDQPPGMWGAIRARWYGLLAAWAGLIGAAFLGNALVGDEDYLYHYLDPSTITVAVVMGAALVAGLVALLAEVVVSVLRTRERARLHAAADDPAAPRPAEGALARGSAPRRLGLTRVGALLVGMSLPFVIAAKEATGDEGSYFMAHADAVDRTLWVVIALFAVCVLAQTIEYHFGRAARNRVMARWPSLWHETNLSGW